MDVKEFNVAIQPPDTINVKVEAALIKTVVINQGPRGDGLATALATPMETVVMSGSRVSTPGQVLTRVAGGKMAFMDAGSEGLSRILDGGGPGIDYVSADVFDGGGPGTDYSEANTLDGGSL